MNYPHVSIPPRGIAANRPAGWLQPFLSLGLALTLAGTSVAAPQDHSDRGQAARGSRTPLTPEEFEVRQEQRNKAVLDKVYRTIYNQGDTRQISKYFAADFIQHDPALASGHQALADWVAGLQALSPKPVFTVKHVLADGAFVVVHSHLSSTPENEYSGSARLDLYKLSCETIVEHWAFVQAVPASSINGNSMFSDLYVYPSPPPTLTELQEDGNAHLVQKAFAGMITGRNYELLDKYWAGPTYIQHNPRIPNGTAPVRAFFSSRPPMLQQFRFVLADGDLVCVLLQSLEASADLNTDYAGSAVGDLVRIVDGKMVEHWDVVTPVPATTANGNSLFSDLYPIGY